MRKLFFGLLMALSLSANASSIRLSDGDVILDGHNVSVLAKLPPPISTNRSTVRMPNGWQDQIEYTYKLSDGVYKIVVIGSTIKKIEWSR